MLSFVAYPLASALLAWLRQCSTCLLQDHVDLVVGEVESLCVSEYVF
jgi:hypothetical protein